MLNYGLDEPHGWSAKKALKQIFFNEFSQCITLWRELSVPQQQEPISPLSNISLSNHVLTPCHGQGDCPCHSCHGQGGHPSLPSHSSGGQVIRDFSADSAPHLDQGDCSSDLCLQGHFLRIYGKCYSPKDSGNHPPTPSPCGSCQSSPIYTSAPWSGHVSVSLCSTWLFSDRAGYVLLFVTVFTCPLCAFLCIYGVGLVLKCICAVLFVLSVLCLFAYYSSFYILN